MADDVIPEGDAPAGDVVVEPEPFTLPEDFATQVQGWDIPVEKLPEAVEIFKALQTEEGTIDAFIANGQRLGFGLKDLNRLFEDEAPVVTPPAPAAVGEPLDPERLMTAAEVEAMLADVRKETQEIEQRTQAQVFQERQRQTFTAMDSWFTAADIKDEQTRKAIAGFGEKHILPGQDSYDPRVAIAALERGKAEYDTWVEAEAQAYLKRKAGVAQQQPTPAGGGQTHGGGGDDAPPDYAKLGSGALDAAKQRVRDRLRQSGEIGG